MKIRTLLNGLLIATAIVLPASFGIALYSANEVLRSMRAITAADDLIKSATNLRLVAVETVLFKEERAKDQWQRQINGILSEIDHIESTSPTETTYMNRIRKNIGLAQSVYFRLQNITVDANQPAMNEALEKRTLTSLSVITQEVMDTAHEYIRSNREEMADVLLKMQIGVAMIVFSMLFIMIFIWRLVSIGILRPLRNFERATQEVGAGNYDVKLNIVAANEIGEMADTFNAMTLRLQQTKGELVQECANSHRAEIALQESVQYTKAILDNAADGIITIDDRGNMTSINLAIESLFGYSSEELLQQNVKMLMPSRYRNEHDDYIDRYHRNGMSTIFSQRREFEGQHKDGRIFPIDLIVSQSIHRGQPMFVGLIRDISERRRTEQLKTEFVSTVSHELRTPLTSISGSLGLAIGGALGEAPKMMQPMLEIAHKNSLRLSHLIDDLLDIEKLAAGKIRFDFQVQLLMPLIDQAVESTRAYGERLNVSFCVTNRADDVRVRVDSGRAQQVMANFLSNAAKFSPSGGQVEIAVHADEKIVRVSIIDHGSGIPPEFRNRIFQKFAQADSSDTRQKGGTGLGLAITKELIERMDGSVGFSSVLGEGTCFYFELPLHIRQQQDQNATNTANLPRLLVVEDEPDIAQLLSLMLHRAGYQVDVAQDGKEALAYLAENHYAAMTLDLMLPDQTGWDLMRQIRSDVKTEAIPIVVVSAHAEEGKLEITGEFNAIDWLEKPFDEERLRRAIKLAINAHSLQHAHKSNSSANTLPSEKIRVLHVEDDTDLSKVIALLSNDLAIFSNAHDLHDARIKLSQNNYDVVVLDILLPDGSGWELLPELRALNPAPAVIVLAGTNMTAEQEVSVRACLTKSTGSTDELLALLTQISHQHA